MSSSSFGGIAGAPINFGVTALNQTAMSDRKTYLCPKCNNSYDFNLRGNTCVGRVPLILNCKHTMCEECIRISYNKREVQCAECQEPSLILENDKRKIQDVFPVNFYLLGIIYYSKPNMNEVSKLTLRPTGINFINKDRLNVGSNSSLCSDPSITQNFVQEKCSQAICNNPAVLRCADCVEVYCQPCCQTLHKAARGLQSHKIAAISGDFGIEITEKCSIHKDNILEFNCKTCNKIVCAYCIIHNHQNHAWDQLTSLKDPERSTYDALIVSAEDMLKRLLHAHKKIRSELEQIQSSDQVSSLETTIGKYFANLHGRLQFLEKKLREDAKDAKNMNVITLNELSIELMSNIRTLYRLINTAKNLDSVGSNTNKFNVTTIIERLTNALLLPSYLVGQKQDTENIGFVDGGLVNNLEDNFSINLNDLENNSGYQLLTEENLPEDYDTSLPSELASIDIAECFSPTKSESASILSPRIPRSPQAMTPTNLLTNALQPKSTGSISSNSTVEEWVYSAAEQAKGIRNLPVLKNDDREYVNVTHIDHPECFYVHLVRCNNLLQSLSYEINQHVRNFAPPLKTVELNGMYIVKYETKNAPPEWHRGRVVDIIYNKTGERAYSIHFIDYGNTRIVQLNMIRQISSTLAKPRPFAIPCKLYNLYPIKGEWNNNAVKFMAQVLSGIDILMIVVQVSVGTHFLDVDLVTVNSGLTYSLREALIFVGHALPHLNSSTDTSNLLKMKYEKPMPKFHTRSEKFKKEQTMEVVLCNIIDPHNIYIQIVENLNHIDHINDIMARHYNKPNKGLKTAKQENVYVPKPDMVVAVRCNSIGPLWYRASVKKIIDGQGLVEVFLVDYGKTETIFYTDMRRLSDRFRTLECQAILIKMADIAPMSGQIKWDPKATLFLVKYAANKDRLRLIVAEPQNPPMVVLFERQASMDVCINAFMVREQLAISTGKMSETVEWLKDNPGPAKQEPSYVHELMNTIQCSQKTYVDDSDSDQEIDNKIRMQVNILLTKSPDIIYVACADEITKNEQHALSSALANYYSKHHGETANWQAGDFCVVHVRTQQKYFRAIILEKIDDLNFKVMLRDIAQEIIVSKSNMFVLHKKLKSFREGAIRCHLSGVVPAGGSSKWSGLAIELLQDVFSTSRHVYMTKDGPVDKARKSFPVIMWYSEFKPGEALEPSRLIDHNVNKLLIKKGLAFREIPKPIIDSESETKGGDTSSDATVMDTEVKPIPEKQLYAEKPVEDKNLPSEEPKPIDIKEVPNKIHKQLKTRNDFKAKSHLKTKAQRTKQTKMESSPLQDDDTAHGISSDGNWYSATSSDEEVCPPVKDSIKKRPKSAGSIETLKTFTITLKTSASAATSPCHIRQVSVQASESNANATDWNDLIAQDESPKKSEKVVAPVKSSPITSDVSDWLPPSPFDKDSFYAYPTFVDDRAVIYMHEATLDPVLKAMEEKMKPIFDELPPEKVDTLWIPGQLCTVKYFVNDSWYRGKITSVGRELIKVLMVDYGNEEECKHEDLRVNVMYVDLPVFAKKVCLHNVFPKKGSKWLTSDLDELHKQIVDHKVLVTLKAKVIPGVATPSIIKLLDVDINSFMRENSTNLVAHSHVRQTEHSDADDDDVIVEEEVSDTAECDSSDAALTMSLIKQADTTETQLAISKLDEIIVKINQNPPEHQIQPVKIECSMSLHRAKYRHDPLPKIFEGQKLSVTVVSMIDYNKFIFEIQTDQTLIDTREQFVSISEDIKEVAYKQPRLIDLQIGQACVAQYSGDGEWYRGEVVHFDESSNTVHIWFVDFGNFETVPKDSVRAIRPKWVTLPVLQYMGDIDGIEIADDSYFDTVFENMAQYCDTNKIAQILSTSPLRVRLYDQNDDKLAYQDLIDKKMLVLTKE